MRCVAESEICSFRGYFNFMGGGLYAKFFSRHACSTFESFNFGNIVKAFTTKAFNLILGRHRSSNVFTRSGDDGGDTAGDIGRLTLPGDDIVYSTYS